MEVTDGQAEGWSGRRPGCPIARPPRRPRPDPAARHRAQHALARLHRRTGQRVHRAGRRAGHPAGRAAGRLAAHPAAAGHGGHLGRELAAQLHVEPSTTRAPPGSWACCSRRARRPGCRRSPCGRRCRTTWRSRRARRRRWRCCAASRTSWISPCRWPTCRRGTGLGTWCRRASRAGQRRGRVRAQPGRGQGRYGPAGSQRRRDRQGVRAVPAPSR